MSDSTITRLPSYKPAYNPEESLQLRNGFQFRKINGRTEISPHSVPVDVLDRELCVLRTQNYEITNGVRELIAFDPAGIFTEIHDPRRMFTNRDAGNDRVYAVNPTNGIYKATAFVLWDPVNSGTYRSVVITNTDGTSTSDGYYARGDASFNTTGRCSTYAEWYGSLSSTNNQFLMIGLEHNHSAAIDALDIVFTVERIG